MSGYFVRTDCKYQIVRKAARAIGIKPDCKQKTGAEISEEHQNPRPTDSKTESHGRAATRGELCLFHFMWSMVSENVGQLRKVF